MKALLTSKSGARQRHRLIIHAPVHRFAATACGRTFGELQSQDFLVHQTALSADLSDVDCAQCLAVLAPSSRIYPLTCISAYCGKAADACASCPHLPAHREFEAWRELRNATRPDEVWCPSFWQATSKVGGR